MNPNFTDRPADSLEILAVGEARAHTKRPRRTTRLLAVGWLAGISAATMLSRFLPGPGASDNDFSALRSFFSLTHPLGTDSSGRDLLARSIASARVSLMVAALTLLLSILIGGTLGLVSGYFRGRIDAVIQLLLNTLLSFPVLVFALLVVSTFGAGTGSVIAALSLISIPDMARVVRATTISYAHREFVTAAVATGAHGRRVLVRELLPNVSTVMLTHTFTRMGMVIVAEGGLSFLGVGVPPGTPSWGSMIVAGQSYLETAPHISLVPAAFIVATVLALNRLAMTFASTPH